MTLAAAKASGKRAAIAAAERALEAAKAKAKVTSVGKAAGGELQRRVPRRTLRRQQRERRLAHPQQARTGGALGLSRGAGPVRGCGARGGGRRAARAHLLAITSPALTDSSRPRPLSRPRKSMVLRLLFVTLIMLSIDVPVLQAAREVSYSARTFTPFTSAASRILGRPGPGEPSGFLVVPGRAEGMPGRPALPLSHRRSIRIPLSRLQPPQRTWRSLGLTTACTQRRSCAAWPTTAPRRAKATGGRSRSSSAPIATRAATTSATARTENDSRRVAKKNHRERQSPGPTCFCSASAEA